LNFFTTASSDFLYLSIFSFKISNIGKNTKIPKSHLTLPLIKMSYSYFIFNFENCSSLFQILIIYALNWWTRTWTMCQTDQMKDPPFHSLSPKGRANKIPCQPFKFLCIICNHGHWFVNCPIRFDVWDLIKGKTKTYVNEKSIPIYNCYDEHGDYCDNKITCFLLIKKTFEGERCYRLKFRRTIEKYFCGHNPTNANEQWN
jgi:hypothetical protein